MIVPVVFIIYDKGGTIWHFFDKNVQILLARVLKVSKLKRQNKNVNFFSHFLIHPAHHVFVNIKSLVQAKIFIFQNVDRGTKKFVLEHSIQKC